MIGIQYVDTLTKKSATFTINIVPIKKSLTTQYFYESPDIIVFEFLNLKINAVLNSVDIFKEKLTSLKRLNKILIYGYGFDDLHNHHSETIIKPILYEEHLGTLYNRDPAYPLNDSLNTILTPDVIQGMSGSPVFYIYTYKKNTWAEFGGMNFGNDTLFKATYIVSKEITLMEILKGSIYQFSFTPLQ